MSRACFKTTLLLQAGAREEDPWTVASDLIYSSELLGRSVVVPMGFQTDLASVPRLPVVYLLTGATGNEAAVVHDYLYSGQELDVTREQADDIFHEAAVATGMPRWRAWLMWCGVRVGGRRHWKQPPAKAA